MAAAKKKAVTQSSTGTPPSFDDDFQSRSIGALEKFVAWVRSPDSGPYYRGLSVSAQQEFDDLVDNAYLTLRGLYNANLAQFAMRARAQREPLNRAIGDLKRELDGQKRAASIITAVGSLIETLLRVVVL